MAQGVGRKRRRIEPQHPGAPAPQPQAEVATLQLPGEGEPAPPQAEVATPQLPGAPALPQAEVATLQHPGEGEPSPPQAEVDTPQLPGAPAPPQAARPLPLARHELALGYALHFLLRRAPGNPAGRDLVGDEPWPLMGRALEVLQRVLSWGSSLLAVVRWVKTALCAGSRREETPEPTTADALPGVVECKTETPKKHPLEEEPPQESEHPLEEEPPQESEQAKTKSSQGRVKNQAWLDKSRPRPLKPKAPAAATPPPPRPPVIVDGEVVPDEIVDQYANYCSIARFRCSAKSTVCHMCIFEMEVIPNGIVRTSNMIIHCQKFHEGESVRCGKAGCAVKVRPGRDLCLHTHFFHMLPSEWWRRQ